MSNTATIVVRPTDRIEVRNYVSGVPRIKHVPAMHVKVGNCILHHLNQRRYFSVIKVDKCGNDILLTLRALAVFRKNFEILHALSKCRTELIKNPESKLEYSFKEASVACFGSRDYDLKVSMEVHSSNRSRTCVCCGELIHTNSDVLRIEIDTKNPNPKTMKALTYLAKQDSYVKYAHLHDCANAEVRWRLACKDSDIKLVNHTSVSEVSDELRAAVSLGFASHSFWMIFDENSGKYAYAQNLDSMLRVYEDLKSDGILPTHYTRLALSDLNGTVPISIEQVRFLVGDDQWTSVSEDIDRAISSQLEYVVIGLNTNGTPYVRKAQSSRHAQQLFKDFRFRHREVVFGYLNLNAL